MNEATKTHAPCPRGPMKRHGQTAWARRDRLLAKFAKCHAPLPTLRDRRRRSTMHDVPGSHWHEPTAGRRAGFGKFGRPKTPYDLFMESEGIPIFRDIGLKNATTIPMAPWKRLGGRGSYIQLHGTEGKWGC